MMLRYKLVSLLFLLLISRTTLAGIITIDYDVQDIWWLNGQAKTNNTELTTDDVNISDSRIGVMFTDLSSLEGYQIQSAELQMYRYIGGFLPNDMTINLFNITESWSETSVVPSFDDYAVTSLTFGVNEARGWHLWNITELVQGWLFEEVINNGVMLAGSGENRFQKFYSSEKVGFSPKLVINVVDVPEPSTWVLMILCLLFFYIENRKQKAENK